MMDLHDLSETSTMCDDVADTEQVRKDEENDTHASSAGLGSLSKQGVFPPKTVSQPAKRRQGTFASGDSEAVSSIAPSSYVVENGSGHKVRDISISYFVI